MAVPPPDARRPNDLLDERARERLRLGERARALGRLRDEQILDESSVILHGVPSFHESRRALDDAANDDAPLDDSDRYAVPFESSRVESSRVVARAVKWTRPTRNETNRIESKRALGGRTSIEAPGTETRRVLLCDCVRDFNSVSTDGCSVLIVIIDGFESIRVESIESIRVFNSTRRCPRLARPVEAWSSSP